MNKQIFSIVVGLITIFLLTGCEKNKHFITDSTYRIKVHEDYLNRCSLAERRWQQLFSGMDTLSVKEREAMEFLYAYMPYSDLADYDMPFFLKHVRYAFMSQQQMPWGEDVPEDIFRHFVLPYRVNNENLDTARMYMYAALRERVIGLSMEEAALEVNHWCHEHVAYRGTDARTSSPLATMRTALGRCGEESTFTVAALRSVGIPARQCYTPRWAHCDDNHAWVEVWVYNPETKNGTWKFLGACEPDPKLNMGWFAEPASRCMMIHTKAFGRYRGDEDVVRRTANYAELNLLSHYADVCKATVNVVDADGNPMSGATVKFKLYNYAEYYTLATFKTDTAGLASLTTGRGDLLVWASDGCRFGYAKMDTRVDSVITLQLEHCYGEKFDENIDIVPPEPNPHLTDVSDEMQAANQRRLVFEDSARNAYIATFVCNRNDFDDIVAGNSPIITNRSLKILPNANLTRVQIADVMRRCEGNYEEIVTFMNRHTERTDFPLNSFLKSFSDKDMRDITADVLDAHVTEQYSSFGAQRLIYEKGIMPARISNEQVRPWRQPLSEGLKQENVVTVEQLKTWTLTNISVDDTGNYYNCPISPMGVFELRHSDSHSRDIFFVAACRSLGIPAYIDGATGDIFVAFGSEWRTVSLGDMALSDNRSYATSSLTVRQAGDHSGVTPQYWKHYTIQHFENGDFMSLDFEDDERVSTFPYTISLPAGYYCLSTGNRNAKGAVRSRLFFFEMKGGESYDIEVLLRSLDEKSCNKDIPFIDNKFEVIAGMATIEEYGGDKGFVFVSLGNYREPSKHLVKELIEQKDRLARWGGMIYMLVPEGVPAVGWDIPGADISVWRKANDDHLENLLTKTLNVAEPITYPIVAYICPDGRITYYSIGYKISVVEQLLHHI